MIMRGNIYSKTLGMDTGLSVVACNEYKGPRKYRVAYLLHGLCGNSDNWINNSLLSVYARDYDIMFIMPEVGRSFYTDMKYGQSYFTYVSEELPEICQNLFAVSDRREDTAIIGGSMGGYGALKIAFSRPDRFGYCCALAPACLSMKEYFEKAVTEEGLAELREEHGEALVRDFTAIFGEEFAWSRDMEIIVLAEKLQGAAISPKIFAACGKDDPLCPENRAFYQKMKNIDIDFTGFTPEGQHDWYFFNDMLLESIRFFSGQDLGAPPQTPLGT